MYTHVILTQIYHSNKHISTLNRRVHPCILKTLATLKQFSVQLLQSDVFLMGISDMPRRDIICDILLDSVQHINLSFSKFSIDM